MIADLLNIIKADVVFERDFHVKEYTAKLVKTLLITGNPGLEGVFVRSSLAPKPIHITPLFHITADQRGRVRKRAIYAGYISSGETARPQDISKRIRPVKIRGGEKYSFYIGTSRELFPEVVNALSSVDKILFGGATLSVSSLSYEIEYIDLEDEAEKIAGEIASGNVNSLKVVFESPTMLKDPLVIARERKKKIFLPIPEAIFSTPIYMLLADQGRLRRRIYIKAMRYIKSIFDIPYTAMKTTKIAWLIYRDKPIPGLIGYTKYFIDKAILSIAQEKMRKHNIDLIETIAKSITLIRVLGTGAGRATGFGHISIDLHPQ